MPYVSGPQWLAEQVLSERRVLAVGGTHGKTTTTSMLAWILEDAGLSPGFLIGGVPAISAPARASAQAPFFVIEADEYDTAFFDKRAKFVHYRPRTAVLNNLEYDHADIYPDLAAIAAVPPSAAHRAGRRPRHRQRRRRQPGDDARRGLLDARRDLCARGGADWSARVEPGSATAASRCSRTARQRAASTGRCSARTTS